MNQHVEVAKLSLHVRQTLVANRTLVGNPDVLVIALLMYAVTAGHEHNRFGRREHVLAANWTIAICRTLDAFVRALNRRRYASAADL